MAHNSHCGQCNHYCRPAQTCAWLPREICCMLCSRVSYSQERHLFHIVVRDGITFLCMADEVRCRLCTYLLMTGSEAVACLGLLSWGCCMPTSRCSQLARLQCPVHPQEFGRRIPFAFLEDVREKYMAKFGDAAQSAPAYAHNGDFSQVHLSHVHVSPACVCRLGARAVILAEL